MSKELVISNWDDLTARAEFLAKSALIPTALRGKPNDVAVILQMGMELGVPPMQALNGIDVINGKPCVSPQLGIALIRSKVPNSFIQVVENTETRAVVKMARDRDRMDEAFTSTWDMERVKKMGLASKDNYQKQPGNMIKWRAVAEAARVVFPDILKGFYFAEEMIDVTPPNDDPNKDKLQEITRTINAEVVEHEAPTHPSEPSSVMKSFEYVIPFGKQHKGKRLADITPVELKKYVKETQDWFEKSKTKLEPMHYEFFEAASAYLSSYEAGEEIA